MESSCPICWLAMPSDILDLHIASAHREPNFVVRCDFPGCNKTNNVWRSYRQHNWRKHNRNVRDLNHIDRISSSESNSEDDDLEHIDGRDEVERDFPIIPQPPALQNPANGDEGKSLKVIIFLHISSKLLKLKLCFLFSHLFDC